MPVLIAILGPTAGGKSALALSLAERYDGEVISCDSAAVYRGFDIGTDKVAPGDRRGIPHHLVDVADPTECYTAARFAREAAARVRAVHARGRLPILVGGTGFYYRALTRGLFPGPGRDDRMRDRLRRIAARRGVEFLHGMVRRVDPESAVRIQPRDLVRLVRALEVRFLTGRPLTAHFAATVSPLPDVPVIGLLVQVPATELASRIARRVDDQFARGLVAEAEALLASGVPADAQPFGSLGYRQVLEYLRGDRDVAATHELIVRETRQYSRRQLIWFRKEPNLDSIPGPGDRAAAHRAACQIIDRRLAAMEVHARDEETR
ncbi:MAG TPA: tRNA (adenosine(37)-N6)-dimethylallyltransferase MiaA [Vicinamibacterales bacterium]|jgi:tRNA dimethylallyltransferase